MLLRVHLDVILGKASYPVVLKKSTVSSIEDVHFRIGESGILMDISLSVFMANKLCSA
jgi:hypothetical protein